MWFLNFLPDSVDFKAFVEPFGKSYQHTSLQFSVKENNDENEEENAAVPSSYFMVMPFPWSANKENGSFKLVTDDRFDSLLAAVGDTSETVRLNSENINVYKNVKELKKSKDQRLVDFPTISEIWNIYIEEDYGVFVVEIKPETVYRIDYTHKISCLSSLFVQTRYSNLHQMKSKDFTNDIWVSNSRRGFVPKFLESQTYPDLDMQFNSLDRYSSETFDEDLRFATSCWESSDEESIGESSDEENTTPIDQHM